MFSFSTDNDNCKCRRCQATRRNKWCYTELLSAHLFYLSGFKMHEINAIEVKKFEDCLFNDFIHDMNGFLIYVTDLCTINGQYGLHILDLFKNGSFNKIY